MTQASLMTKKKFHDFGRIVQNLARGLWRPRDHDDRQTERPRREEFGEGRGAAAVLAHYDFDNSSRRSFSSASTVKGPRPRMMRWRGNLGAGASGSIARIR